jgi:hypothetical protein
MRILDVFLVAALVTSFAPAYAAAASPVQTKRLMATSVPLEASPTSSVLAAVWQDRLISMREKLAILANPATTLSRSASNASVSAFSASFTDGDKLIVLSALFTTPECVNLSGAAAPNLNNCPMRIAVFQNGKVRVVASASDFPFVAALKDLGEDQGNEFDNETPRDRTLVTFDPVTHEITTNLTLNGVRDVEKSTPIRIAY